MGACAALVRMGVTMEEPEGLGGESTPKTAAMAESGLPQLAHRWVEVLRHCDIAATWQMTDPVFRLALAQMWIGSNADELGHDIRSEGISPDELAAQLANESPRHPLWGHCARVTMRTILQAVGDIDREFAVGMRPRPSAALVCLRAYQLATPAVRMGTISAASPRLVLDLARQYRQRRAQVRRVGVVPSHGFPPDVARSAYGPGPAHRVAERGALHPGPSRQPGHRRSREARHSHLLGSGRRRASRPACREEPVG